MAIGNALKKYFNQTITIEPFTGEDGYNISTFGTAVTYKAKIEQSATMFRTDTMEEITSPRKIFLFTQDTISPKDKITLPAAFPPVNPKILSVRVVTDLPGIHHVVVMTD